MARVLDLRYGIMKAKVYQQMLVMVVKFTDIL